MRRTLPLLLFLLLAIASMAEWPREITTKNGAIITVYQPQPEKLSGHTLDGRCAFSAVEKKGDEPIFGVFWYVANITTDRDSHTLTLETLKVTDVKLPGVDDEQKILRLRQLLEVEIPTWRLSGSLDELNATIEQEQAYTSDELKNDPPRILYAPQSTTLVLIDGEPKLVDDKDLKMKRVINTAFLIVENPSDKKYYLNGGSHWYVSTSVKEGYQPASDLPKSVASIDQQMKQQQKDTAKANPGPPGAILLSTEPAELIQTTGEAQYANITGTALLYVTNSSDDLFKNVSDNQYFVLLSGRWYTAPKLEGPWTYVAADKLPPDFSKIPEGSPKDNVLSSVAGTKASKDALHDAQVPQTAKVDRKKATVTVTYDGEPKFEVIEGTGLELAMNTSSTVLKSGSQYFSIDKGVWFISSSAKGPWKVSDKRPKDVEKIPASSSAYNVKYVYVYDATPDVVYVGYTPGYMGCYVYGPTVVYGTGYYYSPWYGPYYYPRPVTYGFSMHYNPWCGWSMGFHYSSGFFHMSVYGGGYWGPPMYRPPYYPPYRGGMYGGRGPTYIHNGDINIDRSNNIYNGRNDVSTNDVRRGQGGERGPSASTSDRQRQGQGQQPGASQQPAGGRGRNDVYSDRSGNVYQRSNDGNWQQRQGNQWQQTPQTQQMGRDYDSRQRGAQQNSSFEQMNRGGNLGGGMRSGGGGMRGGGGRRR